MRLLVDSGEFMHALHADLEVATSSALAQMMTFEGDRAGQLFANLLIRSRCRDRRLMVDSFSRHVMSNCFVHAPMARCDAELRRELTSTAATHEAMRRAGVRVRFTNPAGPMLRRLPARNHKKSVVIDGRVAYVGGLNISDHNFAWHDLMLRIEDVAVAAFLAEDLEATWRGCPARRWAEFDGIAIGTTGGGRHNPRGFEPVFDLIASARVEIILEMPFLTFPFTDHLRDARRRGARVSVIAPGRSLRGMGRYLEWECTRGGFELWRLPGTTHVKAMLVDGRHLVLGSSNFDFLSYHLLHEILAIVDEPSVVADFARRVAEVDLARSRFVSCGRGRYGGVRRRCLEVACEAVVRVSGA